MRQAKKNEKTRTKRAHPGRGLIASVFSGHASLRSSVPRGFQGRSPKLTAPKTPMQPPAQNDNVVAFIRILSRTSLCLVALFVLSALVLLTPHIQAESSSATVAVTVPIACSLGTDNSVHNYSATVASGQVVSGIGGTRMSAYCNDNNGYTIYAIGASGGADGNTNLINTTDPSHTIATGTTTSGPISSWAMRLTPGTGTSTGTSASTTPTIPTEYQSYFAIPSSYTAVASKDSSTGKDANSTTTGNYITAEYQIYIGTAETPGTYLGRVKYAMLHPYTSGTPKDLETVLDEAYNAGILTSDDRTAITTTDEITGGTTTKTYYKMQSLTSTMCSAVNVYGEASQTQMIDSRDNKIYWVTKLEDGHCWMTQNLDLDLISDTSAENYVALTSENTDLNEYGATTNDNNAAHGYNNLNGYTCTNKSDPNAATSADCTGTGEIITWLPERSTIAPGELSPSTWTDDSNNPYSYDPGPTDAWDSDMTAANSAEHRLTGNYYNWTSSIASNRSNNFKINTMNNVFGNPKNSVCPKNWRLPMVSNETGYKTGTTNEFRRLNILYNDGKVSGTGSGINLTRAPLYLTRAGFIYNGSFSNRGAGGLYWSSTVHTTGGAYSPYFYTDVVGTEYTAGRYFGFSVRCLLR